MAATNGGLTSSTDLVLQDAEDVGDLPLPGEAEGDEVLRVSSLRRRQLLANGVGSPSNGVGSFMITELTMRTESVQSGLIMPKQNWFSKKKSCGSPPSVAASS